MTNTMGQMKRYKNNITNAMKQAKFDKCNATNKTGKNLTLQTHCDKGNVTHITGQT